VSDGDTLDICIGASRIRARLCGIDAPERDEATKAFRALVVQGQSAARRWGKVRSATGGTESRLQQRVNVARIDEAHRRALHTCPLLADYLYTSTELRLTGLVKSA
jgi:endonuclease YncB( thermonuclease family)